MTKYPNGENVFNPNGSFNPPSKPLMLSNLERIKKNIDREKHLSDVEFVNQNARGK
jgi:hypothetical protein